MKILVTGATGFVGKKLVWRLFKEGHDLVILARKASRAREILGIPAEYLEWDLEKSPLNPKTLDGVDGVMHLAGESIASKRWNNKRKSEIYNSRILTTRNVANSFINLKGKAPSSFITASAVGIFGDRGDETLTEMSTSGDDFLSHVCVDWEAEANKAQSVTRVVHARFGVILGEDGGALQQMARPFLAGVGGKIGNGKQWMSWIHLDDTIEALLFLLKTEKAKGPFNIVAPQPVTNKEFTKTMAEVLGTIAWATAPAPLLKIALGEMAQFILGSLRVVPQKLEGLGFSFQYPHLKDALTQACAEIRNQLLETVQFVPRPIGEVFNFFADAKNLETITPPWLNFKVLNQSSPQIKQGTEINYQLRVHGIPMKWKTEIETWSKNDSFIDNQVKGPYQRWHHTHTFVGVKGGTLMTDRVSYRLPVGPLGSLVAGTFVKNDVEGIFLFRRNKILEIFK